MTSVVIVLFCVLSEYLARTALREWTAYSYNVGAAFGIMGGSPDLLLWLEFAANVIVVGVLFFVKMRRGTRVGLSLMLGGAVSNLGERILFGHVIDWIPVPLMNLQYNLSDVFIALGALLVFLAVNKKSPEEPSGEQ